jgi:hypothetical protein
MQEENKTLCSPMVKAPVMQEFLPFVICASKGFFLGKEISVHPGLINTFHN